METLIEKLLYASRWVMAPVYLGLSALLIILAFKFFQEVYYIFPELLTMPEKNLILKILTLVDLTLVGSLVVMVMLAGYENFVSRFEQKSEDLSWLSKLGAGSLKVKVASAIVAISSIHLLQVFLNVRAWETEKVEQLTFIHLAFILSALILAVLDRIMAGAPIVMREAAPDKSGEQPPKDV